MPWMEQTQMQEKEAFIAEWMAKEYVSFAELCDGYGVSRKTGYKWVGRFKAEGLKGLHERARGCPSHP
jgi:putative transposase